MQERKSLRRFMIFLAIGIIVATLFLENVPISRSAPPQQDAVLKLRPGDQVDKTLFANNSQEIYEPYTWQVYVPAGQELSVWIGSDEQGGCFWYAKMYVEGNQVGRTSIGPAPDAWSPPITAVVPAVLVPVLPPKWVDGYATVEVGSDTSCLDVTYPVHIFVHFEVSGSAPPPPDYTSTEEPSQPAAIEFWADRTYIRRGECTNLQWHIENVQAGYLGGGGFNNQGVTGPYGSQSVCPATSTTYDLRVIRADGGTETRQVTIQVEQPGPTPTSPPSPTVRPSPTPLPPAPVIPPTPTATLEPTLTPTPTPTPTSTPTPTPTSTPTTTPTPTITPTPTPAHDTDDPTVLVITDAEALGNQLGQADAWDSIQQKLQSTYPSFDVLDLHAENVDSMNWVDVDAAIEARVRSYTIQPRYLLIVGGPRVVAFAEFQNPMQDGDTIFSDDVYGDLDRDAFTLSDMLTARLPDGDDPELYNVQFHLYDPNPRSTGAFTQPDSTRAVGHSLRPFVHEIAATLGTQAILSGPQSWQDVWPRANTYFILHGSDGNTSKWWGDGTPQDCCPQGEQIAMVVDHAAGALGTVVSAACYGAYLGEHGLQGGAPQGTFPDTKNSIALRFLRNGAEAFVGYTAVTYSTREEVVVLAMKDCDWFWCSDEYKPVVTEMVDYSHVYLDKQIWARIRNGEHPLSAYHFAKYDLVGHINTPEAAGAFNSSLKALHSAVYYGLPPSN